MNLYCEELQFKLLAFLDRLRAAIHYLSACGNNLPPILCFTGPARAGQ